MTDTEKIQQRKGVAADHEKAREDLSAQTVKIERIADVLETLARALRTHPELVTKTPEIDQPDYRGYLAVLERQQIVDDCAELRRLKDRERTTEKRLRMLSGKTNQSIID